MADFKKTEAGRLIYNKIGGLHAMESVKATGMQITDEKQGAFLFSFKPQKNEDTDGYNFFKASLNSEGLYDVTLAHKEQGLFSNQKNINDVTIDKIKVTFEKETKLSLSLEKTRKSTLKMKR